MSLDVPFPGKDTRLAVQGLADDWVICGPIRIAQHLSNVWHLLASKELERDGSHYRLNGANIFGPIEIDHPWTKWAAESHTNYGWLYYYAEDLCEEYLRRFGHKASVPVQHGIKKMLTALDGCPEDTPEGPWSEPSFANARIDTL